MLSTSALLTDRYELTMLQAALQSGKAHRKLSLKCFQELLPVAAAMECLQVQEDYSS